MHLSIQGGRTALMMASEAGKVECVNVLLDRGSEVNLHNEVSEVKMIYYEMLPLLKKVTCVKHFWCIRLL